MKASELRSKSVSELKTELANLKRERFKMRLLQASGELTQTHKLRASRRDIARCETLLREKKGQSDE